jgi:hypothetical protein
MRGWRECRQFTRSRGESTSFFAPRRRRPHIQPAFLATARIACPCQGLMLRSRCRSARRNSSLYLLDTRVDDHQLANWTGCNFGAIRERRRPEPPFLLAEAGTQAARMASVRSSGEAKAYSLYGYYVFDLLRKGGTAQSCCFGVGSLEGKNEEWSSESQLESSSCCHKALAYRATYSLLSAAAIYRCSVRALLGMMLPQRA